MKNHRINNISLLLILILLILPQFSLSQERGGKDIDDSISDFCGTWRSPSTSLILSFKCNSDNLEISNYDTLDGEIYYEDVIEINYPEKIVRTHLFVRETNYDLIIEYSIIDNVLKSKITGSNDAVISYYKILN